MSSLPKIAWIGLGIMGSPMSENLVRASYDVTGYTLERDKLDRLAAAGGAAAGSIAEAVRDADVIITMVPASPQVEAIAYGPEGILAHARSGALLIDMSSITPQTSVDLAKAAAEKGIRVLDAPVSGGEAGAIEAVLSIMVGGEQADFDEAEPVFEALGNRAVRAARLGADREGRQPADRRREHPGVCRGRGLPGEVGREPEGRARRPERRPRRLDRADAQEGQLPPARLQAGLPDRPAPQGHGHRHRRGPQCRRGPAGGRRAAQLVASLRAQGDGGLDHSALLRAVERLSGAQV